METWKPVVGWEDSYEVSDQGRVRRSCGGRATFVGRIQKPTLSRKGYPIANLNRDGRRQIIPVHKLVALAFIGPRPAGKEINHLDGNKTNNALPNLEFVTPSENMRHSYRVLGRRVGARYGSEHVSSKLKEEQVLEIVRRYKGGERQHAIAACFGVHQVLVSQIVSGKAWSWLTGIAIVKPE
jgi:NUMOD4 motif./HNH endonuclease.